MDDDVTSLLEPTVGLTAAWVLDIAERARCSEAVAFAVLRAGLHALRDCLSDEAGAAVAREFPALIRGLWFEDWRPARALVPARTYADWLVSLEGYLLAGDADSVPAPEAARALFAVLARHLGTEARRSLDQAVPPDMGELLRAA
ncbi:MAG: DUF2267 domain-containing protein [Rhodobacteraceae bacterium]|jgi:uncharacterized protein (DUF2267 family)|nr:DUF2267 domain-containing protein [Paracoccaceae bacterium]